MTRLYLMRHGESEWNTELRIQGHRGGGLSPRGQAQARATGNRLRSEGIGAVFTSDLARAAETATIIGGLLELPVVREPRLRERDMGDFAGLVWEEVVSRYPTQWENVFRGDAPAPNGESRSEVVARMRAVVQSLLANPPADRIAIVAHGGCLRSIYASLLGLDERFAWRFRVDNCAITIADLYPEGAIFDRINDRAHLEAEGLQ